MGPTPTAPPIGTHWEKATGLDHAAVSDVARGPSGWVAVGSICIDCRTPTPAAWFSMDGLSWTGGPISDDANGYGTSVATDGSSWFAAGESWDEGAGLLRARIWRSADGKAWTLVHSIVMGGCPAGCPWIEEIVTGPGGTLLSWAHTVDRERSTAYWGEDGQRWTPLDKSSFGWTLAPQELHITHARVTFAANRFFVAGDGGGPRLYTSPDGMTWTHVSTGLPSQFCGAGALEGSVDRLLLVGDGEGDCSGIWVSRATSG